MSFGACVPTPNNASNKSGGALSQNATSANAGNPVGVPVASAARTPLGASKQGNAPSKRPTIALQAQELAAREKELAEMRGKMRPIRVSLAVRGPSVLTQS